ncbi:uncharacterized protein [Scyliorhinus torazame]|uniref:uncharacterized protein n=1 Tax=Scyliorhinus torazame TaxID=75743 RepID=UPI003B5B9216
MKLIGAKQEKNTTKGLSKLRRIKKHGLKLNKTKCQFGVDKITFLGDKLSAKGVQADQEKIKAILNMPHPTDKKGVLRMLGMINFTGKFIPNLTKATRSSEIIKKDTIFQLSNRHEHEWQMLQEALTTAPMLTFFDPTKKTKILTDASKIGWEQCYCSRTMMKIGFQLPMRQSQ